MKIEQLVQVFLRTGKLEGKTNMPQTWYERRLGQFQLYPFRPSGTGEGFEVWGTPA